MTTKDILVLTMVKGIGPATLKKYLYRLKFDVDYNNLIKELKPTELEFTHIYEKNADRIISTCKNEGIDIIDITSCSYPASLIEITTPPAILYVKGNKNLLTKTTIAIIGTRNSSKLGNQIAERLGQYFSQHFAICNGLVEGIDEHSVYINNKTLPNVIGIISGGLCYQSTCSRNHIRMIEDVLSNNGLLISEFPPMKKEDQYSGSTSSRIQAGLSTAIILVQSKLDGGSKYTFDKFVKLGRIIGVVDFSSNPEFKEELFEANRIILREREHGIAKFVGLKTDKSLKIKSIVPIASKDDYLIFEKEITTSTLTNLFDC